MSEDNQTIQRILTGDTELFRLLVERYQRPVIRMVRNLTGDAALCEDIAQEVFFTAYRKLASFDGSRSKFSTWLFTIARNKSINALRERKVFHTLPEEIEEQDSSITLEEKESFAQLDKKLDELPAKLKRVFVLAEIDELAHEDIAEIENASVGTIRTRISRAKEKLRAAFEKNFKKDVMV